MRPDIKAIRARADAATPGEWRRHPNPRFYVQFDDRFNDTDAEHEANAQFCAHARTDVPALLDYVESLEQALASSRAQTIEAAAKEAERRIWDPGDMGASFFHAGGIQAARRIRALAKSAPDDEPKGTGTLSVVLTGPVTPEPDYENMPHPGTGRLLKTTPIALAETKEDTLTDYDRGWNAAIALADRLRAEGAAMKHLKQLAAEARAARRNMRSSPFADILAFERLADAIDALPDGGVVGPRAYAKCPDCEVPK